MIAKIPIGWIECPSCSKVGPYSRLVKHLTEEHSWTLDEATKWVDEKELISQL